MKKTTSIFYLFLVLPILCSCTHAKNDHVGPFEYKEIYLPDGIGKNAADFDLNSVDEDWGLWGHNLSRMLPKDASIQVYATLGGQRLKDQYCFSSDRLYEYIVSYIDDTYGSHDTHRFAILPNDNAIVCQCDRCIKAGNKKNDASPAVFNMIKRLAKHFPDHMFFTSYYNTTKKLPDEVLPANVGVLVSAIEYGLCPVPTNDDVKFEKLLQQWAQKVNHVYVWDYVNNFDDYFTPFPVLRTMQHRFQLYTKNHVKGIFLNGSGTDYSTLQELHTKVLSELLKNPNQDIEPLVRNFCKEAYPNAGKIIADFVLLQEDWAAKQGKILPIYDGVAKAIKTYLPEQEFIKFHDALIELLPKMHDKEKKEVEKMFTATSLTRLELMRLSGNTDDCRRFLNVLISLPKDAIEIYSESCWLIDSYVRDYNFMLDHIAASKGNILKGHKLVPLCKLDEEYNDVSILTDGLLGFPSNYHCGQMIFSAAPTLKLAIPHVPGMKKIRVWMTNNVLFHIVLPERITLTSGGAVVAEGEPVADPHNPERSVVDLNIPSSARGTLVLNIMRNMEGRSMAVDEIEAY